MPRRFDLVVHGATAPGICAAVRAAREGLRVAIVTPGNYVGGSLPSLGAIETHYRGNRAPLLQEFIDAVRAHYRSRYGEESEAYRVCTGGSMTTFEPHVAEEILNRWLAHETNVTLLRAWRAVRVEMQGRRLWAIVGIGEDGAEATLEADAFIEASYEGDLLALAGVETRVGRESREEFGEPRAGRVFTRWLTGVHPRAAAEGRLNLVTARATTSEPLPGSTGAGDHAIQSYSYRFCLTDDPQNRRPLATPPENYDRARYAPLLLPPAEKARLRLPFHHRFLIYDLEEMAARDHVFHGHALPNRKRSWNATNLTAGAHDYPTATPERRREIERAHRDHALGLMWFLQNDDAVPPAVRAQAQAWGFARDEFVATNGIPPQLYVREARRLVGRRIFTENDALLAPGAERAPTHADAIAITEFSLDSLACTTERLGDSLSDGQLFQMEVSRPGHVPWGALLPRELDNLVAVTTVSATHVGWGTVRQTPTLMHLAEAAGFAVALSARMKCAPAEIDPAKLQHVLVERGVMISFFNDCDMGTRAPWLPAVQWLGCRGFFPSYDVRPNEPLDAALAEDWAQRADLSSAELRGLSRADAAMKCYCTLNPSLGN